MVPTLGIRVLFDVATLEFYCKNHENKWLNYNAGCKSLLLKDYCNVYNYILDNEGCWETIVHIQIYSYNAIYTGQIAEAVRQTLKD